MTAFKNPTHVAAISTLLALGAASACGTLDERDFSGDPSDVTGPSGDGDGGGDPGDGDGDIGEGGTNSGGSAGDGDGDGTGGSMPPIIVDEPDPNPGCAPPTDVVPLSLQSAFPPNGRSASGADVVYDFAPLNKSCAVIECRLTHGDGPTGDWEVCDTVDDDATKIRPFSDAESASVAANGYYEIEMRERFEGASGALFSRTAYIHNSLDGVARCPNFAANDSQILGAAAVVFQARNANSLSSTIAGARANNPFIHFDFNPPAQAAFTVSSATAEVEYLSLRRHFTLNSAGTIVMMKRVYESKRLKENNPTSPALCSAATLRIHTARGQFFDSAACDVVAMNSQGFGLCLDVDSEGVVAPVGPNIGGSSLLPSSYYSGVDHFMWSKLDGKTHWGDEIFFSPKCYETGGIVCAVDDVVLPHRDVVLP